MLPPNHSLRPQPPYKTISTTLRPTLEIEPDTRTSLVLQKAHGIPTTNLLLKIQEPPFTMNLRLKSVMPTLVILVKPSSRRSFLHGRRSTTLPAKIHQTELHAERLSVSRRKRKKPVQKLPVTTQQ